MQIVISSKLWPEEKAALLKAAEAESLTPGDYVRRAVLKYLGLPFPSPDHKHIHHSSRTLRAADYKRAHEEYRRMIEAHKRQKGSN